MAVYTKTSKVIGGWFKGADFYGKDGLKAKIITEVEPVPSQFKNEDGTQKIQDVGKVQFEGIPEPLNMNINAVSRDALVEAFGNDSTNWVKKLLFLEVEKTLIGGKRAYVPYLIPDGYERVEDEMGYMHITKKGKKVEAAPEEINLDNEPNQEEPPF